MDQKEKLFRKRNYRQIYTVEHNEYSFKQFIEEKVRKEETNVNVSVCVSVCVFMCVLLRVCVCMRARTFVHVYYFIGTRGMNGKVSPRRNSNLDREHRRNAAKHFLPTRLPE